MREADVLFCGREIADGLNNAILNGQGLGLLALRSLAKGGILISGWCSAMRVKISTYLIPPTTKNAYPDIQTYHHQIWRNTHKFIKTTPRANR